MWKFGAPQDDIACLADHSSGVPVIETGIEEVEVIPESMAPQPDALARRESSQVTSPSRDPFMLMRILSDDLDGMPETFGFWRSLGFGNLMQQGMSGTWSPQIEISIIAREMTRRQLVSNASNDSAVCQL